MKLSVQTEDVKNLLQEKLLSIQMKVGGEGCNFQLNLISDELAGQSPVKRQQQVYAHLNAWAADDSVHAATTEFFSRVARTECSRAHGGSLQWTN